MCFFVYKIQFSHNSSLFNLSYSLTKRIMNIIYPQCAVAYFISVASSYLHVNVVNSSLKKDWFIQSFSFVDGNFLSSHTVSHAILSAFVSLTFVFDMGTSGSSQLLSPPWLIVFKYNHNYIFLSFSISHFLNSW